MVEAFAVYDKNGDKKITMAELAAVMKKLRPTCPQEEIVAVMADIDKDHDGIIDYREFVQSILEKREHPYQDNELRDCFASCDKNGDGHISVAELRETMTALGQPMTDKEAAEVMKLYDKDGNMEMDFLEFTKMANTK